MRSEYISGKKPLPKPKNVLFRAVTSFIKLAPVQVEIILKEGSEIGDLNVIHVPGHTPGSICLLDEERKVLFSGDTLRFDGKKISGAPEQFSMNPSQVRDSIIKISMLIFDVMLPGHGEPLKPNASNEVKKFIVTLK
jgi:glyoxylase-like metal-dependent hydrolase (beta-lactamase superfamily II)